MLLLSIGGWDVLRAQSYLAIMAWQLRSIFKLGLRSLGGRNPEYDKNSVQYSLISSRAESCVLDLSEGPVVPGANVASFSEVTL
ncbi:hypothetical protein D3C77_265350 [compost metagenome]